MPETSLPWQDGGVLCLWLGAVFEGQTQQRAVGLAQRDTVTMGAVSHACVLTRRVLMEETA